MRTPARTTASFAADALSVFGTDAKLWCTTIAARLRDRIPGVYADITPVAVGSQLREIGVTVKNVREPDPSRCPAAPAPTSSRRPVSSMRDVTAGQGHISHPPREPRRTGMCPASGNTVTPQVRALPGLATCTTIRVSAGQSMCYAVVTDC